jgi:Siphovirus Gp157
MYNYKSLYQIESEYLHLLQLLDDNDGLLNEEIESLIKINSSEIEDKTKTYYNIVKELESSCNSLQDEIQRINQNIERKKKSIETIKGQIKDAVVLYGNREVTKKGNDSYELKFSDFKIRLTPTTSLVIDDESLISNEYKNTVIKETTSIDKNRIKDEINNGVFVEGCHININHSVKFS